MVNNTSKKFLLGFGGIIIVGLFVWVWGTYANPEVREKRALIEYFEDLTDEYRNDTYGGATPEETLALFIKALEANDIDLASKYFLPDERGEIKGYLTRAQDEAGDFSRFVVDAQSLKLSKKDEQEAFYTITNEEGVVEVQVILKKNQNNVWKITDL